MAAPGAPQLAQASELFEAIAQAEGHVGLQGGLSPEVWAELRRPPPRPEPAVEQDAGPTLVVAALPGGARLSSSEVSVDLLDGAAADAALAELLGPGDRRRLNLRMDRDLSFQVVREVQRAALDAGFASYTVTMFSSQSDDVPVP